MEAIAVVRKWAPVVGWRDARSFAAHSSDALEEGIGQEARRHRCSRQARASGAACLGRVIDARAPGCTHAHSSVEPTVSASAERAGVLAQASPFWFPAETTVRTPSCFAAWMASSIACSVPAPLSDMLATTFLPSERPPASRCLTTKSRASSTSPKVPAPSSSRTLTAITRVVAHLSTPHLSFASEAKATPRRRQRGARARARVTVSASRRVRVPRARAPSLSSFGASFALHARDEHAVGDARRTLRPQLSPPRACRGSRCPARSCPASPAARSRTRERRPRQDCRRPTHPRTGAPRRGRAHRIPCASSGRPYRRCTRPWRGLPRRTSRTRTPRLGARHADRCGQGPTTRPPESRAHPWRARRGCVRRRHWEHAHECEHWHATTRAQWRAHTRTLTAPTRRHTHRDVPRSYST